MGGAALSDLMPDEVVRRPWRRSQPCTGGRPLLRHELPQAHERVRGERRRPGKCVRECVDGVQLRRNDCGHGGAGRSVRVLNRRLVVIAAEALKYLTPRPSRP